MTGNFFWDLLILIPLMILGAIIRHKFDRKYAFPVVQKSKSLSILWILCLVTGVAAMVLYFMGYHAIMFYLLLVMIPFVVFLNFKTYFSATKDFVADSKKNRNDGSW